MTISIKALKEARARGDFRLTEEEHDVLVGLAEADMELCEAGSALEAVPRHHIGERVRATNRAAQAEAAVLELLAKVTR